MEGARIFPEKLPEKRQDVEDLRQSRSQLLELLQLLANMNASGEITLHVNGESKTCSPDLFLPDLLQQMGLNPRLLAVEYNGEILHRQFWETTQMQEGDRLEIVTIVGGG